MDSGIGYSVTTFVLGKLSAFLAFFTDHLIKRAGTIAASRALPLFSKNT